MKDASSVFVSNHDDYLQPNHSSQSKIKRVLELLSFLISLSDSEFFRCHTTIFKWVCIPESFNTNISHQLFDYTITFVNSQHKKTNSKGDFVPKKGSISVIIKNIWLRFGMTNFINKHFNLRFKIPTTQNFLLALNNY